MNLRILNKVGGVNQPGIGEVSEWDLALGMIVTGSR